MIATERLYYQDSHLIEFEARVVDVTERVSGWTAVVLDRTAFYPTGGGQPSDTGTLNGARVVECIDDGDNGVLHVVQGAAPALDEIVAGRVDWSRRLDHMQQHTGQHILSQAFVKLFDAPTKSFRVLDQSCEIDVELANPTTEIIERAVEFANNVIWEDRAITIHNVSAAEAAAMPLRKEPAREGELRLIQIEDFDLTPCGGTHAVRTGEVGMIAMRSWARAKGLTRMEFVAGVRALADYRRANRTAREVAALFSTGRDDSPQNAAQLIEENKELHRRVRALEEVEARVEAERLLALASVLPDGTRVVSHVFGHSADSSGRDASGRDVSARASARDASARDASGRTASARDASAPTASGHDSSGHDTSARDAPARDASGRDASARDASGRDASGRDAPARNAEFLKNVAHALITTPKTVALLASRDKDTARLVFARSADASGDMNTLMREACALLDGRGGGKPDLAQGGGKHPEKLDEALNRAVQSLS
ncbi:MAG TPA: DHHA1 domain-containing protein [Pyrinomonadaceae bacterium]|nr:DHHA1 domain-containing protein [Pyrinomonadaceae bacterium]